MIHIHSSVEEHVHLVSPIHQLDTRFKLIGMLFLIFSFAFISKIELLIFSIFVSFFILTISKLPFRFVLQRIKLPGLLIFMVAIVTLFFSEGSAVFHLGPLSVTKEGIHSFILILVRFISIMMLMVVLLGSTSIIQIIKAMRDLKLPTLLCDMIFFSYRYIFELGNDLKTMHIAMNMRGFRSKSILSIPTFALLSGSLLIRSYEQSDRVYNAMTLRGYGQNSNYYKQETSYTLVDCIWLIILILLSAFILCIEFGPY